MDAAEILETWRNGNKRDAYLAIRDSPNPAYALALVAAYEIEDSVEEYEFLAWFARYSEASGDAE